MLKMVLKEKQEQGKCTQYQFIFNINGTGSVYAEINNICSIDIFDNRFIIKDNNHFIIMINKKDFQEYCLIRNEVYILQELKYNLTNNNIKSKKTFYRNGNIKTESIYNSDNGAHIYQKEYFEDGDINFEIQSDLNNYFEVLLKEYYTCNVLKYKIEHDPVTNLKLKEQFFNKEGKLSREIIYANNKIISDISY